MGIARRPKRSMNSDELLYICDCCNYLFLDAGFIAPPTVGFWRKWSSAARYLHWTILESLSLVLQYFIGFKVCCLTWNVQIVQLGISHYFGAVQDAKPEPKIYNCPNLWPEIRSLWRYLSQFFLIGAWNTANLTKLTLWLAVIHAYIYRLPSQRIHVPPVCNPNQFTKSGLGKWRSFEIESTGWFRSCGCFNSSSTFGQGSSWFGL